MYLSNNAIYPFLIFLLGTAFARYNLFARWIGIGSYSKLTKIYKVVTEGGLLHWDISFTIKSLEINFRNIILDYSQ